MKNVLFVSIAFPPKNDPECLQTAKYFKYLVDTQKVNINNKGSFFNIFINLKIQRFDNSAGLII